jgi:crossover junction endodeoxyribonuclease RuvC
LQPIHSATENGGWLVLLNASDLDILMSQSRKRSSCRNFISALASNRQASSGNRHSSGTLRLLGIDPGTRYVGWGVIERDARTRALRLVDCGCIVPPLRLELKDRLCEIFSGLEYVIRKTRPDAAALEETFAGVNMKSAIAMGEGRGIALLCLARAGLRVLELSPASIKKAVAGSGAARKEQVAAMVAAHLVLTAPPRPMDTSDALAAAIALAQRIDML